MYSSSSCNTYALPSPTLTYVSKPAPVDPNGPVGISLDGIPIYAAFQAGLSIASRKRDTLANNAAPLCSGGSQAVCQPGIDVYACRANISHYCGANTSHWPASLALDVFGDSCGGHGSPYRFDGDMPCNYDSSQLGHSPLVGFALDGYGIYGRWESHPLFGQPTPPKLDACGGHVGPVLVPSEFGGSVTVHVYHYHLGGGAPASVAGGALPYTVGCWGPAPNYSACVQVSPSCGSGFTTVLASNGSLLSYDTYCPCGGGPIVFEKAVVVSPWTTSGGNSNNLIIGLVVGLVCGLILLFLLIFLLIRRSNANAGVYDVSLHDTPSVEDMHSQANMGVGEFTLDSFGSLNSPSAAASSLADEIMITFPSPVVSENEVFTKPPGKTHTQPGSLSTPLFSGSKLEAMIDFNTVTTPTLDPALIRVPSKLNHNRSSMSFRLSINEAPLLTPDMVDRTEV